MLTDETTATDTCIGTLGFTPAEDVEGCDTFPVRVRFGPQVDGIGTCEAVVPGCTNPTTLALPTLTAILTGSAASRSPALGAPEPSPTWEPTP